MSPGASPAVLSRRLGLRDAVVIGLASMIGAGAFVSLGAAQDLAGSLAPAAVLVAAVVALCNATSTAQLAAQHPAAGGTFHYGRERLGPWWGFLAGWCFVIGKTASCAAMALVVAAYLVPEPFQRPVAALLVVVLTAVNLVGITRTAVLARVLVTVALAALVLTGVRLLAGIVAGGPTGGAGDGAGAGTWEVPGPLSGQAAGLWDGGIAAVAGAGEGGALGIVLAVAQAAALMFFAFAGYARVATLGEEVVAPRRTIPRAILLALAAVGALYLVLSVILVLVGPAPGEQGWGPAPFRAALDAVGAGGVWAVVVTIGAVAAASGALLALVAGISRTVLAMARERDLPPVLAHVSPRFSVPQRAEAAAGIAVVLLVLLASDVLVAIAASSFGVLLYYAVANLAALTQTGQWRLFPKAMQWIGLAGCVLLVAALPGRTIVAGLVLVALGLAYRGLVLAVRR
ncbi:MULTISPECIES: APC family permease [Brachybacterium]|uniref:Amino acid permease n=2 Tax=Brachybacterium TaxID=43668 RepID=A0A3R8X5Q4_9MICO|nr:MULTISPECIES: APC family permease [Brachybacterium]RRR18481.1 amino acid permease [Brachybacterium paraconglomeratum]GLI30127.1 amino acid transporter [Brachybacterium conglomeratum]GLK04665.1 amino acid transporter [Brachybacterium conglomeratum]